MSGTNIRPSSGERGEFAAARGRKVARDVARIEFRKGHIRLALAILLWPPGWSHTTIGGRMSESAATTARRIYVAASWRNPEQALGVKMFRQLGHEVYDFRNPRPGDTGFAWSEIDPDWLSWKPTAFRELLESHPVAYRGFMSDFKAMEWADTFVLMLPSGRSAHLEAGWAIGKGKPTAILLHEDKFETELMYLMADRIAVTLEEVCDWLDGLGGRSGRVAV